MRARCRVGDAAGDVDASRAAGADTHRFDLNAHVGLWLSHDFEKLSCRLDVLRGVGDEDGALDFQEDERPFLGKGFGKHLLDLWEVGEIERQLTTDHAVRDCGIGGGGCLCGERPWKSTCNQHDGEDDAHDLHQSIWNEVGRGAIGEACLFAPW